MWALVWLSMCICLWATDFPLSLFLKLKFHIFVVILFVLVMQLSCTVCGCPRVCALRALVVPCLSTAFNSNSISMVKWYLRKTHTQDDRRTQGYTSVENIQYQNTVTHFSSKEPETATSLKNCKKIFLRILDSKLLRIICMCPHTYTHTHTHRHTHTHTQTI